MKKISTSNAFITFTLFLGVTFASGNPAYARDHYRLGTLNESHHYRDNADSNSSHDGFYLVHNRNVFGTYFNSEYQQSFFYARNSRINDTFSFSYGAAIGYDVGVLPMVGVSAQLGVFKLTFTQEAAVIGLEFPL